METTEFTVLVRGANGVYTAPDPGAEAQLAAIKEVFPNANIINPRPS